MKEIIEIFRMNELSVETKCSLIIKLGEAKNYELAANWTEPVVAELIQILNPNHEILKKEKYSRHLNQVEQ